MLDHDWKIDVGYDNRFGYIKIGASKNGTTFAPFYLSLLEILKSVGIPPYELKQLLSLAKANIPDYANIEPVRRKVLTDHDFTGKTVLDVGGYDGEMASIALSKGAGRATCLDNHQYEHYGWEDKKFDGVEYVNCNALSNIVHLSDEVFGIKDSVTDVEYYFDRPDAIIFYNVLYHLKNPWAALDHLRTLIKPDGVMFLCTLFRYHDGPWMYVYEPRECNPTDDTVYFGPSIMALERLLAATGWSFKQEGMALDRVVYTCKPIEGWQRKHEDS